MFYLLIISTSFFPIFCLFCLLNQDNGCTIPPTGYLWRERIVHLMYTQLILLHFVLIFTTNKWLSCVLRVDVHFFQEYSQWHSSTSRKCDQGRQQGDWKCNIINASRWEWQPWTAVATLVHVVCGTNYPAAGPHHLKSSPSGWNTTHLSGICHLPSFRLFRTKISHMHTADETVGLPLSTLCTYTSPITCQASNSSH